MEGKIIKKRINGKGILRITGKVFFGIVGIVLLAGIIYFFWPIRTILFVFFIIFLLLLIVWR